MKTNEKDFPHHAVLEKPWSYRVVGLSFQANQPSADVIELTLEKDGRRVALRFNGVHSLKVEPGFPWTSAGIQILDAAASGMEKSRIRVCNYNFEQDDGIEFWATEVTRVGV